MLPLEDQRALMNEGINYSSSRAVLSSADPLQTSFKRTSSSTNNFTGALVGSQLGAALGTTKQQSNITGNREVYSIKAGDTLTEIAQRELGSSSRWTEIKKADGSSFSKAEARRLQVGQKVYLPSISSNTNNSIGALVGSQLGAAFGATKPKFYHYREVDHYRVELKAWIPQDGVVDPLSTVNRVKDIGILNLTPLSTVSYDSHYRGDSHIGYNGSYRVKSWVEFDYNGDKITNLELKGDGGTSHRDWRALITYVGPLPPLSPAPQIEKSGTEELKADDGTYGKAIGSNRFIFGFDSENPVVKGELGVADKLEPAIDANLDVSIANNQMVLRYDTDQFPSYGIQVIKNGTVLNSGNEVVWDASGVDTLGAQGAANLATRLSSDVGERQQVVDLT